ncbi:hypothetical protein [Achromobacter aloeverae]
MLTYLEAIPFPASAACRNAPSTCVATRANGFPSSPRPSIVTPFAHPLVVPLEPTDFYKTDLAGLHRQLLASSIVRTHLTGAGIRLDGEELTLADRFDLPFGTFSTLEFAHLFSIFDGSRVHQQAEKSTTLDDAPPGLYFTIINTRLLESKHKNRLGVFQRADDASLELFIEDMHIDHYYLNEHRAPRTLGTLAFTLCAITAHLAGMGRITLVAADGRGSSSRYVGAKVWPKLGFDAPLLPGETAAVPHLADCVAVQDVMARDETWWAEHATQRRMAFDLTGNSSSWQKLLPYTSKKLADGNSS